ncbi:Bug family tripartite tricarboxylate transporter substrate binding protein [Ramlibacter sp.]|uniref:Bug family tripartite tricarboxylate transporter substrate binding protein n=1 Tax=Ramlibacter sp. TaxID=1917967 RepID=UPI003D09A6FC
MMYRRALVRAALALPLALASIAASAQAFPTKPIRWVVPYAAGGPADVIARALQPKMAEFLGQPVVIDNRPGGNANIGHDMVSKAAPDGYTILYVVPNIVTNPLTYKNMVDPLKDLAPVARITSQAYILVANPNFPAKNVAEMIDVARKQGVNCASGGGLPGFGCMWFKSHSKADFTHVLYKGNTLAMNDLIAGQINVVIDLFNTAMPQVRAGKVKPLALTGSKRGMPLPDLPVIAETIPGFVLEGWHGVMITPGTPAPIVDRINQALRFALADPAVAKRITDSSIDVAPTSPAEFAAILREDQAKYTRITQDAGIKPE